MGIKLLFLFLQNLNIFSLNPHETEKKIFTFEELEQRIFGILKITKKIDPDTFSVN